MKLGCQGWGSDTAARPGLHSVSVKSNLGPPWKGLPFASKTGEEKITSRRKSPFYTVKGAF